jgi:hypothetical protein
MLTAYSVHDKVKITNPFDHFEGETGTIIAHDPSDDTYLVEFVSNQSRWYGRESFEPPTWNLPKTTTSSPTPLYCSHNWKKDSYFTARVYKTCSKCGAKHEEVNKYEDDGVPF